VTTAGPASSRGQEPAQRFVHACLRARWDPSAADDARIVVSDPDFDWDAVRALAERERVAPLVHSVAADWSVLPPPVATDLRRMYLGNLARNLRVLWELRAALDVLAAAGIDALVLKGAALAQDVYVNEGLRPMGDLDLLVRERDVPAAVAVLETHGYARAHDEPTSGSALAFENELALWPPRGGVAPIEVHWSLFDSPHYQATLPMAWFWSAAVTIPVADTTALALAPEALLLHLCGHLVLHHGQGADLPLLWLHDVAEVIHRHAGALDWDVVLTQARACDLVLCLQHVLPLVADGYGLTLPDGVRERLAALPASPEEQRLHAWLTADHRPPARRLWEDVASTPRWASRLRLVWSQVVPSPTYMRHRYGCPSALVPLAYPYRWLLGLAGIRPRVRRRAGG
jgi:hypothetical protein